ncbi:MAG: caspase family protein [Scytonematopsis contorta HA4267-MV1]|jgi:uncharacterized caspase-like protein|nr:caspase family protein [Scytonematopsis contorta HA4267-MV1]
MTNNWAVAIGINQYQFFQPLGCAQADAEALKEYLVSEVGFLPEQCVLMTDTSPTFADMSTYPTKENILLLLENLAAKSWQPHDQVWFFFSGYGVNQDGQDYLMPVEGHPDLVVTTGIDIRGLLQSLQVARTDILVLLDINRAFGTQANAYVGKETLEVAKELPVPTILSCQSEQFSYESSELGHGFFTAALIEALRSQNANTVGQLANYLSTRIPELCQHHWRPTQNPAIAIPNSEQVILPKLRLAEKNQPNRQPLVTPPPAEEVIFLGESQAAPKLTESPMISGTEAQKQQGEVPQPLPTPPSSFSSSELSSVKEPKSESAVPDKATNKQEEKKVTSASSGKNLLLWLGAGMMFLSLIVAFMFRNLTASRDTEQFQASPNTTTNENRRTVRRVPNSTTPQRRPSSSTGGNNSQDNNRQDNNRQDSNSQDNNRQDNNRQDSNSQDNNRQDNNRQENQLPASTVQPQQEKRALAELAKMSKNPNQANDLSEAIAQARRIKPGVRGYEQAQENIQVWSRMILDLAEERMKQGQFPQAIAAAQLLTREDPLYQQAQEAINQWRPSAKQFLSNKTLIDAATALVRPRQASTYNRAIEVAKRVPQGEAGYELAQKSINQWSLQILDIANARAAGGDLKSAISTATLVPEGTSAYNKAQDAIQKWQKK